MALLTFDPDALKRSVATLPAGAALALGLSAAERLLPNYVAFQNQERWGDVSVLRRCLDCGWRALAGEHVPEGEADTLRRRIQAEAPDTEDFETILVSSALDAACAAELVLDLLKPAETEGAFAILSLCRDTVDMYVQEQLALDPADPQLEEKIRLHPLMQRELRRQADDLARLAAYGQAMIDELRRDWRAPARSNLDLP